ncbi:hypothetical protein RCO48_20210 [Peribacillus frigoritolerans]|nr:hypothetical protein [Peribacillus frigoritolerans]
MIGTEGTRLLREKRSRGDPAGESRGGSPTARGKRVPEVEINVPIVQAIKIDKLDFSGLFFSIYELFLRCYISIGE